MSTYVLLTGGLYLSSSEVNSFWIQNKWIPPCSPSAHECKTLVTLLWTIRLKEKHLSFQTYINREHDVPLAWFGCCNVLAHLGRQRGGDKRFQISVKSPVEIKPAHSQSATVTLCVAPATELCARLHAWSYLLQELAELAALGISGAQVLLRSHHGADAASVCILSGAVHLPPLFGPDGLHWGGDVHMRMQSQRNDRNDSHHDNCTVATLLHETSCFILLDDQTLCLVSSCLCLLHKNASCSCSVIAWLCGRWGSAIEQVTEFLVGFFSQGAHWTSCPGDADKHWFVVAFLSRLVLWFCSTALLQKQ